MCAESYFVRVNALTFLYAGFHNVTALEFAVSVNVFFRHPVCSAQYQAKDLYGNRDLRSGMQVLEQMDQAAASIASLPAYYRQFYLLKAQRRLQDAVERP